jgi:hypothetical protein
MSSHLPECDCYGRNHGECALCNGECVLCICNRLRSCEQRVREDMLAKCIAAIEEWALENPYEHPSPNRIITALRALQEKQ